MFGLESFQQGGQSNDVYDGVEEAGMNEGESIRPVHWMAQSH